MPNFVKRLPPLILCLAAAIATLSCASTQDGSSSFSGTASVRQLGHTDYIVRAATNGFVGPARLRPLLTERAKTLARDRGYAGVLISRPLVSLIGSGDGFLAEARVLLVNSIPAQLDEFEYIAAEPVSSAVTIENGEIASATLRRSNNMKSDAFAAHIQVLYFSALEKKDGPAFAPDHYAVAAGEQHLGVVVTRVPRFLAPPRRLSMTLKIRLEAGKTYQPAGEELPNSMRVWIEEVASGKRHAEQLISF